MSQKVISCLIILSLALLTVTGCTKKEDNPLQFRMETQHFKFYCYDQDVEVLDELALELENKFAGITGRLQYVPTEKIDVEIYPSVDVFHTSMGHPNSPKWMVGYAGNGKVQMVSPLNPGPAHTYESLMKAVVHEFTHLIVRGHNKGKIPIWLNEGIACYESQNIDSIKDNIRRDVEKGLVPTFAELEVLDQFSQRKGYFYSPTIIEFLVDAYGYDKVVELVKNPDIPEVFGISEEALHAQWVDFLERNYSRLYD